MRTPLPHPTILSTAMGSAASAGSAGAAESTRLRAMRGVQPAVSIRHGRAADARAIARLIVSGQGSGFLLPRSQEEIRAAAERFATAVILSAGPSRARDHKGRIVGAASLEPYGPHLAEVRSLVVHPAFRAMGIGDRLVRALMRRARREGVARVIALTTRVGFFERLGFVAVPLETLPEKVLRDCAHCPRRTACIETAFVWRTGK